MIDDWDWELFAFTSYVVFMGLVVLALWWHALRKQSYIKMK
jgi:cbb3-type cytochrome oxidase subunit 3